MRGPLAVAVAVLAVAVACGGLPPPPPPPTPPPPTTPTPEPTPEPEPTPIPECFVAEPKPTACAMTDGVPPTGWYRVDPSWIFPDGERVCGENDTGCWHRPVSEWLYIPAGPTPTPTPTETPTPIPTPPPPGACYSGTWYMECKWDSCDIHNDPPATVDGRDWGAAARDAITAVLADGFPIDADSRIKTTDEPAYVTAIVGQLRASGWCGATIADDPRVSADEIGIWPRGPAPEWKEHLDVAIATDQPPGLVYVSPATRGITARGWRRMPEDP